MKIARSDWVQSFEGQRMARTAILQRFGKMKKRLIREALDDVEQLGMAQIVTVTITYDINELTSLQDELKNWIRGNVTSKDVMGGDITFDYTNASGRRAWGTNWSTIKIKGGHASR
jgi:hypothetical protein